MTAAAVAAAAALIVATGAASMVIWRLARDTGLGLAHPGVVWALFMVVFFGIGGLVLAIGGHPGPAAYTAGAMAAAGIGLGASGRLARRRAGGQVEAGPSSPVSGASTIAGIGNVRAALVVGLAFVGLAAIAPTLIRTGVPFFVEDITGARVELAGLTVQVPRVTLPALAAVALLLAGRRPTGRARAIAAATISIIAVFEVLLASRYLVAELATVLGLTWILTGRRIPASVVVGGAIAAAALFAGIQVARAWDQAAGEPLAFALGRTVDRVILIGPRTLDALMTVIPAEQEHFGGLTWIRRLAPLFGRDDVPNLGYWIFPRVIPGGTGYAAPGWLGEAWANLGWSGLALFAVLGVGLERLGALVAARRGHIVDAVAAALLIVFLARTHALGVVGVGVLAALVVVWRMAAGPDDGLARDLATVLGWRPARRSTTQSAQARGAS